VKLPDAMTKADMVRLMAKRRLGQSVDLHIGRLDREIAQARALLPRLDEHGRDDLGRQLARVTGGGSGVMAAGVGEANRVLEDFRLTLRHYRRLVYVDRGGGPAPGGEERESAES
jgi:hypothetical protein